MTAFNSCSHLVNPESLDLANKMYSDVLKDGKDPLQTMLNLQNNAQQHLSDLYSWVPRPDKLETCGQVLDWLKQQDDSIADETRELYTALGGMSRGEKPASGVWKPWKANNQELRNFKYSELSEKDKLELMFEMIDQLHFILAKFLGLGMDAETIFKMYALKQAENIRRWDNGY
ncbi:dCTP pyrophosphatase [Pectobacterium phage POP12]|nr:dCTP pyrophosphatase [Pectobacterium phage POP12]